MFGRLARKPEVAALWLIALVGCPAHSPSTAIESPEAPHDPPADPGASQAPTRAAAPPTSVHIASWNIRRLGQAKTDLQAVASVLERFDIVAIQEVMTREVADALRAELPEHEVLLTDTPRPTHGTHREFYGFIYRTSRFDPVMNTFYPDPADAFVRDPYIACFDGGGSVGTLCLLTVHIVWGKRVAGRKNEILAVDDALHWGQAAGLDAEWIVLGDFNRPFDDGDADTNPEEEWRELVDPTVASPMMFVGPEVPTTLGQDEYANAYDHCFVSSGLQPQVRAAHRIEIVDEVCDGSFERCRKTVSDHAPYAVQLQFP